MISAVFVDRPRLAIVLAILITMAGALSLLRIPVAQFPDIVPPQIIVSANFPGASAAVASGPALPGPWPTSSANGNARTAGPEPLSQPEPASIMGTPVKLAWVVLAFLISLVLAGPLLAYANWQLLRGRRS